MTAATDLSLLLASLDPVVRPGAYVFVTLVEPPPVRAEATVHEVEGVTLVVARETADAEGWTYDFVAGWITLRVHSSLAAVGLTAAVSSALAEAGISGNVLAGFFHDHLLVPVERVDDAVAVLESLSERHRAG